MARAVPVECANFIFRAVPVKQGINAIRFSFRAARGDAVAVCELGDARGGVGLVGAGARTLRAPRVE